MKLFKRYMKKLIKITNKEEMKVLPGHLSFFLVLSLIPAVTLIGLLCNVFNLSSTDIINFFDDVAPTGVMEVVKPFIHSSGSSIAMIYLVIGFILVSNGAFAIIQTSNTLYGVKNSNQLKERIKSVFLTILLMFLFVFILIVLAFGNKIVGFILDLEMFNDISSDLYHVFVYFKWPLAFFIIYLIIKLIYTLSPDRSVKSKTVTKGAIFTTICWLGVTAVYSYYVNNVARYDLFYGNLSNIIILMMWIYVISYIFVIGIAINVNSYNAMVENTTNENNENVTQ